jgi:hypothetical protein
MLFFSAAYRFVPFFFMQRAATIVNSITALSNRLGGNSGITGVFRLMAILCVLLRRSRCEPEKPSWHLFLSPLALLLPCLSGPMRAIGGTPNRIDSDSSSECPLTLEVFESKLGLRDRLRHDACILRFSRCWFLCTLRK